MTKLKKPFLFAVCLIPIAIIAGIFTGLYQLEILSDEVIEEAVAQYGSTTALVIITAIQTVIYALFCGFFGYILADKIGLWKPIKFEKKKLAAALVISVVGGILLSLDQWTFGSIIDGIQETNIAGITVNGIAASLLYGGIIEELMMRLFLMSLIAWILWKLFFRKYDKEHIPAKVFVIANLAAALLFAAGHIPATISAFGTLTPLILFRCFLLNGAGGIVFGRLYRKYGIQYAMTGHAMFHIVMKLIWYCFGN
ncbi:MAG: CPBP family glutamic-type intramembrane protease [Clostridium sp.]|nr:CPBP family glutamic-type intramembrane protease [Clostridium sp.]MCM1547706.1 CPBP family glutamic-type intramembrane protease [Ruminococcus sp.]